LDDDDNDNDNSGGGGECYAKGSRGISCSDDIWNFPTEADMTVHICTHHYDILAEIQHKPTSEQIQYKRVKGTYISSGDRAYIPDKDYWERTYLPSYRDEGL
jgi:hypothetical protein